MNILYKKILLVISLSVLFLFFQNCIKKPVNLDLMQKDVSAQKGNFCLKPPETTTKYNKILFVVDKSGSNTRSDPNKEIRAGNIQDFLDAQPDDEFQKYGFIAFGITQSNKVEAYINDGDSSIPTFSDKTDLQNAIDKLVDVKEQTGCTPYEKALSMTKQAIVKDINDNPNHDSTYNIFFLSDGQPDPLIGNCGTDFVTQDETSDRFLIAVKGITALSEKIFFSTAYYNSKLVQKAEDGLEYMANTGNGRFMNLRLGASLDFSPIQVGEIADTWTMKQMMVVNLNRAYCFDSEIGPDSDADGLCDKDELMLNSAFKGQPALNGKVFDPQNRNSIDDKYSDFFVYKFALLGVGGGLDKCNFPEDKLEDRDFDLLNTCEEYQISDDQVNGPTVQWTKNMMDIYGETASPDNPDSDGDGFLDSFELFQFNDLSSAVNYSNVYSNNYENNTMARTIMEEGRHPLDPTDDTDITDFRAKSTGLNLTGQNCYDITLDKISYTKTKSYKSNNPTYSYLDHNAGENVMMVYYISTTEKNPNGLGYLFYKFVKVKDGKFENNDFMSGAGFKTYQVKDW